MPESLLPGEPHCATAPVVVAESIASLLRTLHADDSWNFVVSAAVVDRLQHVESLTSLLLQESGDSVGRESDKPTAGDDVSDVDRLDKTVTVVGDDVIETVSKKDMLSGN